MTWRKCWIIIFLKYFDDQCESVIYRNIPWKYPKYCLVRGIENQCENAVSGLRCEGPELSQHMAGDYKEFGHGLHSRWLKVAKLPSLCTVYDTIFEISIDNHVHMLNWLIVGNYVHICVFCALMKIWILTILIEVRIIS